MARFLEIHGWHVGHDHQPGDGNTLPFNIEKNLPTTTYVNIYRIDEISDYPYIIARTPSGRFVRENNAYVRAAGTRIKLLQPVDADHDRRLDLAAWYVYGAVDEWIERIEAALLADRHAPPPAPDGTTLTLPVIGEWEALRLYAKDDVVRYPGDPGRYLLSLRENQSSVVPDKDGDGGWCLLPLQSAS